MGSENIREVTESSFDREVLGANGPVLVEFFASWCGNCRRLEPILDRLADDPSSLVGFVRVDAEENSKLAAEYAITSTPTLILFEGGEQVASAVGAQPEQRVRELMAARPDHPTAAAAAEPTWVPAEACRLPTAEQPLRVAAFDDLFAAAVRSVERISRTRLRLSLAPEPEVASKVAELAVRETDCCGFFTFVLTAADEQLQLEASVPEGRTEVLDGLAARAANGIPS